MLDNCGKHTYINLYIQRRPPQKPIFSGSNVIRLSDTPAYRRIKPPIYTSSQPHYSLLPHNFFTLLPPPPPPRSSLGGYFHSRKCWVTPGSTSSQQSGLKFHKSPDAYFIVPCPLSVTLPPSSPVFSGDDPSYVVVRLQSRPHGSL